MKLFSKLTFMAALTTLLTFNAAAKTPEGWTDNYAEALKQAAAEEKNLLIDFTGSDWCGWCVKLSKEVFDVPGFNEKAAEKFVLVYIDFPRDKSHQSEEVQKQNAELAQKFQIRGYPTILIVDPEQNVLAQTGYKPGGPEAYLTHLDELVASVDQFNAARKAADDLTGLERAKQLDQALETLAPEKRADYTNLIEEIITLDAKNEAKLYQKYLVDGIITPMFYAFMKKHESENGETYAKMTAMKNDPAQAEALAKLEGEFQAKLKEQMIQLRKDLAEARGDYPLLPEKEQLYYALLANTQSMSRDDKKVVEMLTKAIEVAPEGPMTARLKNHKARIEQKIADEAKAAEEASSAE